MINNILTEYFTSINLSYGNPEDTAFLSKAGPSAASDLYRGMVSDGLKLFIGFRGLPAYAVQELLPSSTKVVFLVRHPLDVLVSRYYQFYKVSDGGHEKSGNQSYNEEMLNNEKKHLHLDKSSVISCDSNNIAVQFEEIAGLASTLGSRCQVYNYESFLFNKPHLFSCMMQHMGLPVDTRQVISACKCSDKQIKPGSNLIGQHVRHMYPGDYLNHMDQDLINLLSDKLRDVSRPLGYLL